MKESIFFLSQVPVDYRNNHQSPAGCPSILRIFILLIFIFLFFPPVSAWGKIKVEVRILGLDEKIKDNCLNILSIERYKDSEFLSKKTIVYDLHSKAPTEIKKALKPFGYYKPRIEAELQEKEGRFIATYDVKKGEPVRIQDLDIKITGEGSKEKRFLEIIKGFPLKKGDILDQQIYEELKKELMFHSQELGFFNAKMPVHEIKIYESRNLADISLHFDTGKRFHFGKVFFHQDILEPSFLKRFSTFKQGDPYNAARLIRLQELLGNSGYFSQAQVRPVFKEAEDFNVPVNVDTQPAKQNSFSFGLGYGTDTGPRGKVSWEKRYINKKGHKAISEIIISGIKQDFAASYIIPLKRPVTDNLIFSGKWLEESTESSDSTTFSLGLSRQIKRGYWLKSMSLKLNNETFTVGDDSGTSFALIPQTTWTWLKADNSAYPKKGSRLTFDVQGALKDVVSNVSFLRGEMSGKLIRSPFKDARIILRADAGFMETSNFSDIPASLRFYAGGDNSIRGFAYKELGPKDETGDVVGGKYLLVGSMEYEHMLTEKWSGAVFWDMGNASDHLSFSLKHGIGVGVRWHSPIGPVRIDIASAVSEPGAPLRLHLNIGPDF